MPPPPKSRAATVPLHPASPGNTPALTLEHFQAIARALADPRRFAILEQIARSEDLLCSHLDAQECITPATISHHLKELQEAGLIDAQRLGRQMRLTLRRSTWNAYLHQLQQL